MATVVGRFTPHPEFPVYEPEAKEHVLLLRISTEQLKMLAVAASHSVQLNGIAAQLDPEYAANSNAYQMFGDGGRPVDFLRFEPLRIKPRYPEYRDE